MNVFGNKSISLFIDLGSEGVSAYHLDSQNISHDLKKMYHCWLSPLRDDVISPSTLAHEYGDHYASLDETHGDNTSRLLVEIHKESTQEEIENMAYMAVGL